MFSTVNFETTSPLLDKTQIRMKNYSDLEEGEVQTSQADWTLALGSVAVGMHGLQSIQFCSELLIVVYCPGYFIQVVI